LGGFLKRIGASRDGWARWLCLLVNLRRQKKSRSLALTTAFCPAQCCPIGFPPSLNISCTRNQSNCTLFVLLFNSNTLASPDASIRSSSACSVCPRTNPSSKFPVRVVNRQPQSNKSPWPSPSEISGQTCPSLRESIIPGWQWMVTPTRDNLCFFANISRQHPSEHPRECRSHFIARSAAWCC